MKISGPMVDKMIDFMERILDKILKIMRPANSGE